MKTSKEGIELIKEFEGFFDKPYLCPAKVWTIGFGTIRIDGKHVTASTPKCTRAQATKWLADEVETSCELAVNRNVKVKLNQEMFDALVSFIYNLGETNFKKSTLLKRLNENKLMDAYYEFAKWNRAGGQELKGLTNRRKKEADLFKRGIYLLNNPQT
jgi:lysozyme